MARRGLSLFLVFMMTLAGLTGALIGGLVVYLTIPQPHAPQSTVAASLLGSASTSAPAYTPVPTFPVTHPSLETSTVRSPDVLTVEINSAITDVVERISPAVVTVINLSSAGVPQGSGSGVIYSQDGYVLTNYHVIAEASSVDVIFVDGTTAPAQLVGRDVFSDVAVLRVAVQVPGVAELGNSDVLRPGESVVAIGSPLGEFKNTVTVGVVSATGRIVETGRGYQMEDMLQTDAAINHGNSGGPLVNLAGQVIGLNTLVVRGDGSGATVAEGLGFAVASNTVRAVSDQLLEKGFVSRPFLGIQWESITPRVAAVHKLPVAWGVYVTGVLKHSGASKAGIQPGDIIVALDNIPFDEDHSFINVLLMYQPGDNVAISVMRGTELFEAEVLLGERPD